MDNRTDAPLPPQDQLPNARILGVHEHDGAVRDMVLALKYGGDKRVARLLAEMVMSVVGEEIRCCDLVTWAPTTEDRRSQRGFDQAEILARHVAAFASLRCRSMLRRTNAGSQTGSGRVDRLSRPSFVARPSPPGTRVLVLDDVLTTGATMRSAARALLRAGAGEVLGVAVSRVS